MTYGMMCANINIKAISDIAEDPRSNEILSLLGITFLTASR
jgi:hypothetical protein